MTDLANGKVLHQDGEEFTFCDAGFTIKVSLHGPIKKMKPFRKHIVNSVEMLCLYSTKLLTEKKVAAFDTACRVYSRMTDDGGAESGNAERILTRLCEKNGWEIEKFKRMAKKHSEFSNRQEALSTACLISVRPTNSSTIPCEYIFCKTNFN